MKIYLNARFDLGSFSVFHVELNRFVGGLDINLSSFQEGDTAALHIRIYKKAYIAVPNRRIIL